MKINYNAVNFKLTKNLKSHIQKKLEKTLAIFHHVDDITVFLKVEKSINEVEIVFLADDEKFYLAKQSKDMYAAADLLINSLGSLVRRFKSKQSRHKYKKAIHHNQIVLTKNVKKRKDIEEDVDIFSNKPMSKLEAYLELKTAKRSSILIFRDLHDYLLNIMYKDGDQFILITKTRSPFSFLRKRKQDSLIEFIVEMKKNRLKKHKKALLPVKPMNRDQAIKKMKKDHFTVFADKETGYFSIIFYYGKNKIGLVENVEVFS